MLYDLTTLLITVIGCSATIIGIVGGFIASQSIQINNERNEIVNTLSLVQEELKDRKEKECLKFILYNIECFMNAADDDDLCFDNKYTEDWWNEIDEDICKELWERTIISWLEVKKTLDLFRDKGVTLGKEGLPRDVALEFDKFEIEICKKAMKIYYENLGEGEEEKVSICEWKRDDVIERLENQERELKSKLDSKIGSTKNSKYGLIIFGGYAIVSIIIPLMLIPFSTYNFQLYTRVRYGVIMAFIFGLSTVFIYFAVHLNSHGSNKAQ